MSQRLAYELCPPHAAPARARLCVPGDTCFALRHAGRVRLLVDGDAYFGALHDTFLGAREEILIVGWDVSARTRLRPAPCPDGWPIELAPLLDALVRRRRRLRVRILEWDYSLLYAFERGLAPWIDLDWRTHRRVELRLDDRHPLGASLHEKMVVVDGSVAFVGGLDLTLRRWDTAEHRPSDPRRVDPSGRPYGPFHDTTLMVDGAAAATLGDLARARWNGLAGTVARRPTQRRDAWPEAIAPDMADVEVAIARTVAQGTDAPAVREVERLHLAAIAAAERCLYLENQYFTSDAVADALGSRLREPRGPEVVLVLPAACSGWLEERTMGARRARMLARLREADRFGRLRALSPVVEGGERVNVHGKLAIVDDRLLRVGSANLANRSMAFDRECDLAIEADGRADVARAISHLRARLVGEHLGVGAARLEAEVRARGGSLVAAIDALHGGARDLQPIAACEGAEAGWLDGLPADPCEPFASTPAVERWTPEALRDPRRRGLAVSAAAVGVVGMVLAAVACSPLGDALASPQLTEAIARSTTSPWAGPLAALCVAVGTALFLPVTPLLALPIASLGPVAGASWALVGALVAASAGWAVGRFLLGRTGRRVAGAWLHAFGRRRASRSVMAIAAARLLPLGPFSILNVAAGAARVPLGPFLAGTMLGLLPGLAVLSGVFVPLRAALRRPDLTSLAVALAAILAGAWLLVRVRKAYDGALRFDRRGRIYK
jgi:phosphatidylserine/phosphatidylglycerophosphate/cardiolipin synthase-like enzyme/uncharacterized membrane protein YdjX (TVP38/TMEM64 family)